MTTLPSLRISKGIGIELFFYLLFLLLTVFVVSSSSSDDKKESPSVVGQKEPSSNPATRVQWNSVRHTECDTEVIQKRSDEADTVMPKFLNCLRGGCGYRDCTTIPVHCSGGGCLFENVEYGTCDGGGCKFIDSNNMFCAGGGCDFVNPRSLLIDRFCDGGGCTLDGYEISNNVNAFPACT